MGDPSPADPLMGVTRDVDEDYLYRERQDLDGDTSEAAAIKHEDSSVTPTIFVWLLTLAAGISGLLFGYDTGVISATLISLGTSLGGPLTTLDNSLIVASPSLFALLVSPVSGLLASRLGRKRVLLFSSALFVAGALLQAFAHSVWLMVFGRSVVGLAVGAASFVTPLYIAELSPTQFRGRLVTLNVFFITLGQVVAYLVGWAFADKPGDGWRWMVGLGALPAGVQMLLMVMMPESPRWLVQVGRLPEAEMVLRSVYGKKANYAKTVQPVFEAIKSEVREEEEASRARSRALPQRRPLKTAWYAETLDSARELFGVRSNIRALTIACLLQGLQQLCGFNSLMYFSATIFKLLGFASPTVTSLVVAGTNAGFTVASLLLIDIIGRRKILLLSIPAMVISLAACSAVFNGITLPSNIDAPGAAPTAPIDRSKALSVVALIAIYVASYALGLGNVPWQQSELFPLSVRSLGSSISTATNWGCNFVVGVTFLWMLDKMGPVATFACYAGICAVGWCAIWLVYPETNGLSLEETGELLKRGWIVKRK